MKNDRYEIRLSGSGGQGLILAGIILAEAASILEGRNAVQTQSYGPESRGGASKSEVVISSEEIDYPKVTSPDLLLVMTQEACDKYIGDLKNGGIAVLDTSLIEHMPDNGGHYYGIPITQIAKETVGKAITANIVALGVLTAITSVVGRESLEKAVLARVPKGTEEINRKALEAGFAAGEEVMRKE
jgi:2-oxoglutarate ferredoxin oxidoreductase subunit gamma